LTNEQTNIASNFCSIDQLAELGKLFFVNSKEKSLFELVLEKVIKITGAESGMILLFNPNGETLIETAYNINKQDIEQPQFEISRIVIDKVKTERETLYVPNVRAITKLKKSAQILSIICLPLLQGSELLGLVYLDTRKNGKYFSEKDFQFAKGIVDFIAIAAPDVLKRQKKQIHQHSHEKELRTNYDFDDIVSKCHKMTEILELVSQVADSEATVLIQGESGTGKELIARALHNNSIRKDRSFVAINCGAIAENLLESELFGHVKGAFTGAISDKSGWFEKAQDGTILLDEISEMPPALQVKLLRILQSGEFSKVGSTEIQHCNARVVAATNVDLQSHIVQGKFRQDLYYRLNVIQIEIPPLRNRKCDIPILAQHFLKNFTKKYGKENLKLSKVAEACLLTYDFPGNIRELENTIERAVTLAKNNVIEPHLFPPNINRDENSLINANRPSSLTEAKRFAAERAEKEFMIECLEATLGKIRKAAQIAGIDASNFQKKIKKHNIDASDFKLPN